MNKEIVSSSVKKILAFDSFLNYTVEVDPEVAEAFLTVAQQYNEMKAMGKMMRKINSLIPKISYSGNNPNNGSYSHTVKIGNECSRVVYIVLNKIHLANKDIDIDRLCSDIEAIGQDHGADEVSFENVFGSFKAEVRLWWD